MPPPPPPPVDPQTLKLSADHEQDDLAVIMFHAMSLEHACVKYMQDAAADPFPFSGRSLDSFTVLTTAIAALVGPPAHPDPPLLHLQHQVNVRVGFIPPKNGGFS